MSASCSGALVAAVAPQTVDLNSGLLRVGRHHGVDAVGRDAGTRPLASQRYKERYFPSAK